VNSHSRCFTLPACNPFPAASHPNSNPCPSLRLLQLVPITTTMYKQHLELYCSLHHSQFKNQPITTVPLQPSISIRYHTQQFTKYPLLPQSNHHHETQTPASFQATTAPHRRRLSTSSTPHRSCCHAPIDLLRCYQAAAITDHRIVRPLPATVVKPRRRHQSMSC
jgi:hypothetical protein